MKDEFSLDEIMLCTAMERIARMEALFDRLREALGESSPPISMEEYRTLKKALADYLESGDWLRDYELDEAGLFPPELKRGVLSQDGLYDLLSALEGEEEPSPGD